MKKALELIAKNSLKIDRYYICVVLCMMLLVAKFLMGK